MIGIQPRAKKERTDPETVEFLRLQFRQRFFSKTQSARMIWELGLRPTTTYIQDAKPPKGTQQ